MEEAGGIRSERQARQPGSFSSHVLPGGKPALASLGDRNAKLVLLLDYPVLAKRNKRHGVTPSPRGAARNNTNLTSHTSWRRGLIQLQKLLEKEPNLPSSSHGPFQPPPPPPPQTQFLFWHDGILSAQRTANCSSQTSVALWKRSADPPCSRVLAWDSSVPLLSHTTAGPGSAVARPEGDGAADRARSSTLPSLHLHPRLCSCTSSLELGISRASPLPVNLQFSHSPQQPAPLLNLQLQSLRSSLEEELSHTLLPPYQTLPLAPHSLQAVSGLFLFLIIIFKMQYNNQSRSISTMIMGSVFISTTSLQNYRKESLSPLHN